MGNHAALVDYTAGKVTLRQDVDDATTVTVEVTDAAGAAYDLSAGTFADSEGLFTVDATDAATGILVLTAAGQAAGNYPFTIRDTVGEVTWLTGTLVVGALGVARSGGSSTSLAITVDEAAVTVEVTTAATVPASVARGDGTLVVGDLVTVKSLDPLVVEGLDRDAYATAADLTTEESARADADVVLADEIGDVETYAGRVVDMVTAAGQLSRMVWVPAFDVSEIDAELGAGLHPAFRVGGVDLPGFWCGMYQGVISGGELLSLPNVDPTVSTNYDNFSTAARAAGAGWHMLTNAEWAAITLWALKQGYVERGNTNWGQSHSNTDEEGYRGDVEHAPGVASGHGRTLTGSGPDTWSVPNRPFGIADLVGNVWEWVAGFRTDDTSGTPDIQLIPDNNAATADLSAASLDWVSQGWNYTTPADGTSAMFSTVEIQDTAGATPLAGTDLELARQLGLAPLTSLTTSVGRVYRNSFTGERVPRRGGDWYSGGNAGWFACGLNVVRSGVGDNIGARPAVVVL